MKILLIQNKRDSTDNLKSILLGVSYDVDEAQEGLTGLFLFSTGVYDVVICSLLLNDVDGFFITKEIRKTGSRIPILITSEDNSVSNIVAILDSGADDFVKTPTDKNELIAKIRARTRYRLNTISSSLNAGGIVLDTINHTATKNEVEIKLSNTAYRILQILIINKGKPVSRDEIRSFLNKQSGNKTSNLIDVYVNKIRKRINSEGGKAIIRTISGYGYMIAETD